MPGRGSYGPAGKWIHDRAHRIMEESPGTPKSMAYAVATQQGHKVGKSPKGFRTSQGVREAKSKFRLPKKEYQKTAGAKRTLRIATSIARKSPSAPPEGLLRAAMRAGKKVERSSASRGMLPGPHLQEHMTDAQKADMMSAAIRAMSKQASMAGFFDELEKISAMQKLASTGLSIEELIKVAEHDQEIYELLKQAGVFERMGRGAKQLYERAQVGTGNLMTGSFGHAGEHAAHKLMTTASPTKALLVAAADPHAQKAVLKGARRVGTAAQGKVQQFLQHARQAVAPGPGLVPVHA